MYLPRDFPPRAESHRGLRLRSGIRTPKGMAPCRGTTDGFAVPFAAAWDVLWNRSSDLEQNPTAACDCGPESARQREWRPAAAQRMASLCPLRPPGTFCGTVPPLFPEVNMLSDELRVQIRHWF